MRGLSLEDFEVVIRGNGKQISIAKKPEELFTNNSILVSCESFSDVSYVEYKLKHYLESGNFVTERELVSTNTVGLAVGNIEYHLKDWGFVSLMNSSIENIDILCRVNCVFNSTILELINLSWWKINDHGNGLPFLRVAMKGDI